MHPMQQKERSKALIFPEPRARVIMAVPVIRCQILLVLDAVNSLIEGGGSDARESLVGFINELFLATSYVKLLVTSDKGLKEFRGCRLSCNEEVGDGTM